MINVELRKLRNNSRSRNGCVATAGLAIAEARRREDKGFGWY